MELVTKKEAAQAGLVYTRQNAILLEITCRVFNTMKCSRKTFNREAGFHCLYGNSDYLYKMEISFS